MLPWPDGLSEHHILGLQVGVDDIKLRVHVINCHQNLLCDVLHQRQRDSPVVVQLDEGQEIVSQHLCASK